MTREGDPRQLTTTDGCAIAAEIHGPEQAPVLVLAHALGANRGLWRPQIAALSATHQVIAYDARGHGASAAPKGPYTLERLARDVLDVMDALGIERFAFCGLSMGGFVGQWLGAHAPERIDRLVLASTAPYMGPASTWDERIAQVRAGGTAALVDGIMQRWFTEPFRARHPEVVAEIRAMVLATSIEGYAGASAALRNADVRPDLAKIVAPTLVIAGAHDPGTPPARAEEIARGLTSCPRVELEILEGAHLVNLEQAGAFTRALASALA